MSKISYFNISIVRKNYSCLRGLVLVVDFKSLPDVSAAYAHHDARMSLLGDMNIYSNGIPKFLGSKVNIPTHTIVKTVVAKLWTRHRPAYSSKQMRMDYEGFRVSITCLPLTLSILYFQAIKCTHTFRTLPFDTRQCFGITYKMRQYLIPSAIS